MKEIIIVVLMILGGISMAIAALGLVRLPDLFMRMSATTKAATLGVGLLLLAGALYFDDITVTSRAVATIAFLVITGPIAAHMIARAAYFDGVPLWEGTIRDELRDQYDERTHQLGHPADLPFE